MSTVVVWVLLASPLRVPALLPVLLPDEEEAVPLTTRAL